MTDLKLYPDQLVALTPSHRASYGAKPLEAVDDKGRYWISGNGRTAVFEPNGRFTRMQRDGVIIRGGPKTTFAPGHLAAVKHGAMSLGIRSSRIEEVADALFSTAPWVMEQFDWPSIEIFLDAMVFLRMLQEDIWDETARHGISTVSKHMLSEFNKAVPNALRTAEALGLSPAGRAKIFKDTGIAQHFGPDNLSRLVERGRELRTGSKELPE